MISVLIGEGRHVNIGVRTRVWGRRLSNIEAILDLIAQQGFSGVEFSQRPEDLGVPNIDVLQQLLRERNLVLLSLGNGSLEERCNFLGHARPIYLYIKHWDISHVPNLVERGFKPVLHPGAFSPIRRIEDALALTERYPGLSLICDTAHSVIVGEDPVQSIRNAWTKVAAVHLKDWRPDFGRNGPRYGRGFTEFGKGIVPLEKVVRELLTSNYPGWLVVEIEKPSQDEVFSVQMSSEWLASHRVLLHEPRLSTHRPIIQSQSNPRYKRTLPLEAELAFREALALATSGNMQNLYKVVISSFEALIPCHRIELWTCSPAQNTVALTCVLPHKQEIVPKLLPLADSLYSVAVDRGAPFTRFDLAAPLSHSLQEHGNVMLKDVHSLTPSISQMVTIPLFNAENQNYPRFLLNLFPKSDEVIFTDDEIFWLGKTVLISVDTVLDRLCSAASVNVSLIAGQCEELKEFLLQLRNLIQDSVSCMGVAIFLVTEGWDKLILASTTGTDWLVPREEHFYERNEGLTGKVWARAEPLLTINSLRENGHLGKSQEHVATNEHTCLWMPLADTKGNVIGVVRCRNKHQAKPSIVPNMFLDDDVAVLDAIAQTAVPHLQILIEKDRRGKALGRLTHELKAPIVAIRGAAQSLKKSFGTPDQYIYFNDIWSYAELMRRLLVNADLFRLSADTIPIRANKILLKSDVIAPAVNQLRQLLSDRDFSKRHIVYKGFENIPHLYLDRNQFQQVTFNLLANAIKHCFNDPNSFQVEIIGEARHDEFVLRYRDWGPGIKPEFREAIFIQGYRTPEAIQRNVTGQGVGLWVVSEIVKGHGGRIELTKFRYPTEFSIFLPKYLAKHAPLPQTEQGLTQ